MYNKVLSNCDRLIEKAANPDAQLNERIDSKFCLNQVVELCFKGIIADSIDNGYGFRHHQAQQASSLSTFQRPKDIRIAGCEYQPS